MEKSSGGEETNRILGTLSASLYPHILFFVGANFFSKSKEKKNSPTYFKAIEVIGPEHIPVCLKRMDAVEEDIESPAYYTPVFGAALGYRNKKFMNHNTIE